MKPSQGNTILLITGAYFHDSIWKEWIDVFENAGFSVVVPQWPFKQLDAQLLRNRHPDCPGASLTLEQLLHFYEREIAELPQRPVLVGHSLGGLIVQLLLQRDLASGGIALSSMPPRGIHGIRWFLHSLGLAKWFTTPRSSHMVSFAEWQYRIVNHMPMEQQKNLFYSYSIPDSKRLVRDTLDCVAKVDFKKPHAPLLFMAGQRDRLTTTGIIYSNYKSYTCSNSVTEFRLFKGMNHIATGAAPGVEQAAYTIQWIARHCAGIRFLKISKSREAQ